MSTETRRILAPRWKAVMPILIEALESGTDTARTAARNELLRLAHFVDTGEDLDERQLAPTPSTDRSLPHGIPRRSMGRVE